jgi:hypothetical protein
MAMKIGGEYSSEKIVARHFEQLAEEAGLGRPLVHRRVPELADTVIAPHASNGRNPKARSYGNTASFFIYAAKNGFASMAA